jgi:glycosyltransferase involved in cell wall biosynthesis
MIRLYGASVGHGSLATVAAGMREGLEACGQFAGFVPVDSYDDEEVYPGADADVGLFCGPMQAVSYMTAIGWHRERWALLPANSTWLPPDLVQLMEEHVTGFVAPSKWAMGILQQYTTKPVCLYRHGVSSQVGRVPPLHPAGFSVLHMSSSAGERKGTRQIVEAWAQVESQLGPEPWLTLVMSQSDARSLLGAFSVLPRMNVGPVAMARFIAHFHLVVQPSRGEGFGMLPLEALACGVPVVATDCTGHSEYLPRPGAVIVPTGDLEAIDDGPGAMAPSLRTDDVANAIVYAYKNWRAQMSDAQGAAEQLREAWSWAAVTRGWLERKT